MFRRWMIRTAILAATLLIAGLAYVQGYSDADDGRPAGFIASALAAERPKVTPTGRLPDPNIYYPGTEALAPDEMRLISCGTGMPTACSSWAMATSSLRRRHGLRGAHRESPHSLRVPEQDLHQPSAHRSLR